MQADNQAFMKEIQIARPASSNRAGKAGGTTNLSVPPGRGKEAAEKASVRAASEGDDLERESESVYDRSLSQT